MVCQHLLLREQKEALAQVTLLPVVVANVVLQSAAPVADLGYDSYYWGSKIESAIAAGQRTAREVLGWL